MRMTRRGERGVSLNCGSLHKFMREIVNKSFKSSKVYVERSLAVYAGQPHEKSLFNSTRPKPKPKIEDDHDDDDDDEHAAHGVKRNVSELSGAAPPPFLNVCSSTLLAFSPRRRENRQTEQARTTTIATRPYLLDRIPPPTTPAPRHRRRKETVVALDPARHLSLDRRHPDPRLPRNLRQRPSRLSQKPCPRLAVARKSLALPARGPLHVRLPGRGRQRLSRLPVASCAPPARPDPTASCLRRGRRHRGERQLPRSPREGVG